MKFASAVALFLSAFVAQSNAQNLLTSVQGLGTGYDIIKAIVGNSSYVDISNALEGDTDITVFAPNDAAFTAALGDWITWDPLDTTQENVDATLNVLLTHVIAGAKDAATLQSEYVQTSLAGTDLIVVGTSVNGYSIAAADAISASNGIIHVMGDVIQPPASILSTAVATSALSTLVAVVTADAFDPVEQVLAGDGPFTVFAPINDGFTAAGLTLEVAEAAVADVTSVLQYHVVPGKVYAGLVANGDSAVLTTAQGSELLVAKDSNGDVTVNGIPVAIEDIVCENGVVHAITGVLSIPTFAPTTEVADSAASGLSISAMALFTAALAMF